MNPLEKYLASCSPEITKILDNYLANRRLEEQYQGMDYQDMDIATFGDEYLEAQGANIAETQTYNPQTGRTIVRRRRRGQGGGQK
jgi:hypothetical protein